MNFHWDFFINSFEWSKFFIGFENRKKSIRFNKIGRAFEDHERSFSIRCYANAYLAKDNILESIS